MFTFLVTAYSVASRSRAAPGNSGIGLENIGLVYEVQQSLTNNVGRARDSTQSIAVLGGEHPTPSRLGPASPVDTKSKAQCSIHLGHCSIC